MLKFWRRKKKNEAESSESIDSAEVKDNAEVEEQSQKDVVIEEIVEDVVEDVQSEPVVEKTSEPKSELTPEPDIIKEPVLKTKPVPSPVQEDKPKEGWTKRLTKGLSKSSSKLTTGIADIFTKRKLDQAAVDELEELLIMADMGPSTAAQLAEDVSKSRFGKDVEPEEIKQALAQSITTILEPVAKPLMIDEGITPYVILVVGVNGTGKTTTIAKLAKEYQTAGKSVVLAAGDTFRAAAVEQLQIWAERTGAHFVGKEIGADAAAVAYEAIEAGKQRNADVVIIDTAGRLHNKSNLMDELAKIHRIIAKQIPEAPHSTLITLDATTGQNAINQVEMFNKITPLTGLVVTKLDGSAKGGVVVSLAQAFNIPIHAVGVGEGADDLRPFDANEFAQALVA